jgi:hypothetical protein
MNDHRQKAGGVRGGGVTRPFASPNLKGRHADTFKEQPRLDKIGDAKPDEQLQMLSKYLVHNKKNVNPSSTL